MLKNKCIQLNNFLSNNCLKSSKRIWELDFLRGLCILLIVLDHFSRITYYYFGRVWFGSNLTGDSFLAKVCRFFYKAQTSSTRDTIRIFVLITLYTICGISSHLSSSNFLRATKLGCLSAILSIFSYIAQYTLKIENVYIEFGTLHFISTCIFFYVIIDYLTKKISSLKYIICGLLFIGIIYTYHFYNPPKDTPIWTYFIFPVFTITGNSTYYDYNQVSPGDLMNLIPWSAFYLFGIILKPILYKTNETLFPKLDRVWHKPISFVGKHSLFVYITHIFVIGIILLIISKICFNTWAVF